MEGPCGSGFKLERHSAPSHGDVCRRADGDWRPPRGCQKLVVAPWSVTSQEVPCRYSGDEASACGVGFQLEQHTRPSHGDVCRASGHWNPPEGCQRRSAAPWSVTQVDMPCRVPHQQTAAPGCKVITSGSGNVYIFAFTASGAFRYRVGAGGALSEISLLNMSTGMATNLVAPPFHAEKIDRVLQTVWRDLTLTKQGTAALDPHFNENQAGGLVDHRRNLFDGVIAPVFKVRASNASATRGCSVEVWSGFDTQYQAPLQPHMQSNFSMVTRYDLDIVTGALRMRKVIRIDDVRYDGQVKPDLLGNAYVENWSPFDFPTFDAVALGFDGDGTPNWWYSWNRIIPKYQFTPVDRTNGYAVVFKAGDREGSPALALTYGTKQLQMCHSEQSCKDEGRAVLSMMDFNRGIAILPGLELPPFTSGALLDYSMAVHPAYGLGEKLLSAAAEAARGLPAPRVYAEGVRPGPDIAHVPACLAKLAGRDGVHADNLGEAPTEVANEPFVCGL